MNRQTHLDFARIAEAIEYLRGNFKNQPTLDEVARKVCLSPAHFQRLFSDWAGVSPKKFLQYITVEYAKKILNEGKLSETSYKTGLSSTSRLYDLFVHIEGMTPGEYKNGGSTLSINYSFVESPFGELIVAATPKGICYMAFSDNQSIAFSTLQEKFPNARYQQTWDSMQQSAISIFAQDWSQLREIKLHLKGTDFHLKVWETLLSIPMGSLTTYGDIATKVKNPNASRAVGTAIGDNPVALLIPCHRVIRSSGALGGYHWGLTRKAAIIGWEAAHDPSATSP